MEIWLFVTQLSPNKSPSYIFCLVTCKQNDNCCKSNIYLAKCHPQFSESRFQPLHLATLSLISSVLCFGCGSILFCWKKCVTSYRHTAHAWLQFALYGRCAFKGKLNIDNILHRVSHVSREFSLHADVLIITANSILLWQCRWNQEREREKVLSTQDDFASWEIPGMQSHIARWPSARIQYQCKYDVLFVILFMIWGCHH